MPKTKTPEPLPELCIFIYIGSGHQIKPGYILHSCTIWAKKKNEDTRMIRTFNESVPADAIAAAQNWADFLGLPLVVHDESASRLIIEAS